MEVFLNYFLSFVLFLMAIPLYLLLGIFISISKTFRCFVGYFLTLKTGKQIEFLTGPETFFILNPRKSKMQFSMATIFQKELDFEWIQKWTLECLQNNRRNYWSFFKYPKFSCGFYYWEDEENFDVNNHVILHNCKPPSTIRELAEIQTEIINSNIEEPGKSPWKVLLFPLDKNYEEFHDEKPHYVITIICHHALTDGLGFKQFLYNCSSEIKIETSTEVEKSKVLTIVKKIYEISVALIYLPTAVYNQSIRRNKNILHQVPQIGERIVHFSPLIKIERLRNIRKTTKSTINDIIISVIVGAIEKHFKHENVSLPEDMHFMIPISVRNPQDRIFENKVSALILRIPLGCKTALNRLIEVAKEINKLKAESEYLALYYEQVFLVNQLPSCLIRRLLTDVNATLIVTNIPGFRDLKCKEEIGKVVRSIGIAPHGLDIGTAITLLSINEEITFTMSTDKTVFESYEKVVRFLDDVVKEIELLEKANL